MNRELGLGIAAGFIFGYFGVRQVYSWLVERTFSNTKYDEETYIVGYFTKEVSIFGCENNASKWDKLKTHESYETFDLVPISYRITGQIRPTIDLQKENGSLIDCRLNNDIDVHLNTCVLSKADITIDNNYNGILNYPTQLKIRLQPSSRVIVYGRFKGNIFHVSKLSNYPVDKYKSILVSQKMRKAAVLLGIAIIGSAILFQRYKE